MTSCFLKLYTPTRVCEIIIRNWSAGQLVSLYSRMTSNGGMDKIKAGIECRGMDIRKRKRRLSDGTMNEKEARG